MGNYESAYQIGSQWMVFESCITCGILHGMPRSYWNQLKKEKKGWVCPNGHKQGYYGESATDKKIKRLTNKCNSLEECCEDYKQNARTRDYQARHWKGRAKKLERTQQEVL